MSAITMTSATRCAGLLVPVYAIRHDNDFGIGDTLAVRRAIDFCAAHQIAVLQILPIHETIGDFSPYNPISSRALSPALLTLNEDEVPGISMSEIKRSAPDSWLARLREGKVKYNSVQPLKIQLLLGAYRNFTGIFPQVDPLRKNFEEFKVAQDEWLAPYTLFRLLVREYEGNANWMEWRPEHQSRGTAEAWFTRTKEREEFSELRDGYAYIQWVAWRQWRAVRQYAEEHNVMLMGEMCFGVAKTSVDSWTWPELFDLDWSMGTRPISYFDTNKDSERWGQNWGLPPYRWENHRTTGFSWLNARVQLERKFFHICRLDHLRGYFRAYMFPWNGGPLHAEFAQLTEEEVKKRTGGKLPRFVPGPDEDPITAQMNYLQGHEVISTIRKAAGDMYLFAEIMGNMPDYMQKTLEELQIPHLIFPQLERNPDRSLQPIESYRTLSLASYANHDHAPLASFYDHLIEEAKLHPDGTAKIDLHHLLAFVGWTQLPPDVFNDELLRALQQKLFQSPSQLAVLMVSDLFGIPLRFNLPGSYGNDTWSDRLEFAFDEYEKHPVYNRRVQASQLLIQETGRNL